MAVMQLYPKQSPVPGIDCPKYQPCAGSQRCQYCFGDRACALATEFMCVEPLRRNGRPVPEHHPPRTMPPAQPVLYQRTRTTCLQSHRTRTSPTCRQCSCAPRGRDAGASSCASSGAELRVVEGDAQAGAPRSSRVGWLQRRSHGPPYWQGAPAQGAGMSGSVAVAVAKIFSQRFQALRQRHAFFFRATCPVFGFERLITG